MLSIRSGACLLQILVLTLLASTAYGVVSTVSGVEGTGEFIAESPESTPDPGIIANGTNGALVPRDPVTLTDKLLLISTLDGVLYAIDQTSGIIKWSLQLGSPIVAIYKVDRENEEQGLNTAIDTANKVPFITVDKLPPESSEPSLFIGEQKRLNFPLLEGPSASLLDLKPSTKFGNHPQPTHQGSLSHNRAEAYFRSLIAGGEIPLISASNRYRRPVRPFPRLGAEEDENRDLDFFLSISMYFYTAIAGSCVTIIVFWLYYRRFPPSRAAKSKNRTQIPSALANAQNVILVGKIAFDSKEIIGKGSAGTCVYKGWFEGTTAIAVKRVITEHFTLAQREIDLLRQLHHPNVVRYFATESDSSFKYIAIELAEFSLADFIEKRTLSLLEQGERSEDESLFDSSLTPLYILESSCNGLSHLHNHNVIHRDIKPQNILICKTPSGSYKVLISDFGVSKTLTSDSAASMSHEFISTTRVLKGTDGWIAPEVIKGKLDRINTSSTSDSSLSSSATSSSIDYKSCKQMDIFSLGCLFYYVFTNGHHPFGDHPVERQSNIINNKSTLSHLENEDQIGERTLIASMISYDPSERPSITSVLNHPLFWSKSRRLQFLQDVSDRIEREAINSELTICLERGKWDVIRGDWQRYLPQEIQAELNNHRSYRSTSVSSLLRAIRNKRHHYRELSAEVQEMLGSVPDGFMSFFDNKYPRLVYHCYVAMQAYKDESLFKEYYDQDASWSFAFPPLPSTGEKYFNLLPATSTKKKPHRKSKSKGSTSHGQIKSSQSSKENSVSANSDEGLNDSREGEEDEAKSSKELQEEKEELDVPQSEHRFDSDDGSESDDEEEIQPAIEVTSVDPGDIKLRPNGMSIFSGPGSTVPIAPHSYNLDNWACLKPSSPKSNSTSNHEINISRKSPHGPSVNSYSPPHSPSFHSKAYRGPSKRHDNARPFRRNNNGASASNEKFFRN